MPVTAPPSITALPLPPDPNNRATFNALAYPWAASLGVMTGQVNAVANNVAANAADAATNAAAVQQGANAVATANPVANAASALASRLAIDDRIYSGTYATAPTTKPSGAAITSGDQYFGADGFTYVRVGSAWVNQTSAAATSATAAAASQVAAAASASAAGSSQVGAAASASAAQTYAAAGATAAKYFDTIALGLAGTADTFTFGVRAGGSDGLARPTLYRRNSATTQSAIVDQLKSSEFDAVIDSTYTSRANYVWAILDQNNGIALAVRADGRVILGKGADIAGRIDTLETFTDSTISSRSGYAWGVVDAAGAIAIGLDNAGNFLVKGTKLVNFSGAVALNTKWITPSGFWWYGDSLSASGAPAWLASYLGKTVTVGAVGGQTAQQVAARFGGQVPLFTVAGNTIPASGAVAVTARSVELITAQNTGLSYTGKLYGIAGTFSSDASTFWNFTRTTAGSALTIDPATPFLIDILDQRLFGTCVLWPGRNNVGSGTFNADVKQALADIIGQLKTQDTRFVVLSVLNWPGETTGTANFLAVNQLNLDLKALYPRNYLNVLDLLRRQPGDGSTQDNADIASGIIPTSLRNGSADGHLNNTLGNPIVATRVFQFLTEKGWTV